MENHKNISAASPLILLLPIGSIGRFLPVTATSDAIRLLDWLRLRHLPSLTTTKPISYATPAIKFARRNLLPVVKR